MIVILTAKYTQDVMVIGADSQLGIGEAPAAVTLYFPVSAIRYWEDSAGTVTVHLKNGKSRTVQESAAEVHLRYDAAVRAGGLELLRK